MGCFASKSSRPVASCEDSKNIASDTPFSVKEVEALYELFKKISSLIIKDELINKDEFQLAMFRKQSQRNFFADRLFDLFDCNCDGVIDFEEFVRSLGVFHPDAQFDSKVAFTFKLHDLRNSGFIERSEVKQMVFSLLHESELELPEDIVELIVEKTFSQAAKGNRQINFDEWKEFVSKNPSLIKNMDLPYLKEITLSFPSFSIKVEHQNT